MAAGVSQLQDASWQDRALIGVKKVGSETWKYFAGLTQEIDLPDHGRDVEGQPVMNGGRIRENSAEDDFEVTLTMYPIGVLTGDGSNRPEGVAEWFLTDAVTADQRYSPSLERYDFNVAIMWTDESGVDADSEIGADSNALRWVYKNGQITEFNQDFGDMVHTAEVTFKFTPYDETGSANYYNESVRADNSDTLSAV